MDVTHTPAFGKVSFVHVTMITFSHAIVASAKSGETTRDVIQQLFQCFSQIGFPEQINTDNASAYTSTRTRQWHPTPVLLPGKSHGWRSLVGCNPWGC